MEIGVTAWGLARPAARRRLGRGVLVTAVVLQALACDCASQNLAQLAGGDPRRGEEAIRSYGCGSCHTIPGIAGANGLVGPPLAGIAQRSYVGGVLTNTPENMVRWIENPPAVDSKTAMPNLGVSHRDALDIAGYLYSLK